MKRFYETCEEFYTQQEASMNYPLESPEEFRNRRETGYPRCEEDLVTLEDDDSEEAYEPGFGGGFI